MKKKKKMMVMMITVMMPVEIKYVVCIHICEILAIRLCFHAVILTYDT